MSTQLPREETPVFPAFLKVKVSSQTRIQTVQNLFTVDLRALLLSTAIFELAGNIAYVMLMEKAYDLGRGPMNLGASLIIQAGT